MAENTINLFSETQLSQIALALPHARVVPPEKISEQPQFDKKTVLAVNETESGFKRFAHFLADAHKKKKARRARAEKNLRSIFI